MAFGPPRYLLQALNLARSLIVTNPDMPRAIVTDQPGNPALRRCFQHIMQCRPERGGGTCQKVYLYDYSPFEETLFLDADCLALRPLDDLWKTLSVHPVGVLGHMMSEGDMWFDIAHYCRLSGKREIPRFNGGVYYFNRSPLAQSISNRAVEVLQQVDTLGPKLKLSREWYLKGGDELCFCIALSEHNLECVEDCDLRRQIGPVQLGEGKVSWDLPHHVFRCETPQKTYHSFVAHFFSNWDKGFHYQRETTKLRWIVDYGLPRSLASAVVNTAWNPGYFLFTQAYRAIRRIKNPSVQIPAMTCWPYSYFGAGWRARAGGEGKA